MPSVTDLRLCQLFLIIAVILSLISNVHCLSLHHIFFKLFTGGRPETNLKPQKLDSLSSGEWPDPNTAPVWPTSFQAKFQEIEIMGKQLLSKNTGTWYYDFDNLTARFDHDKGQTDDFCNHQGMSPKDPKGECRLLFTKPGDMWVMYPSARNCCRLCGTEEGCTVLKPDWLAGAKLLETLTIEGRTCAGWAKKGAVAAADTWYVDQSGVPCRYHEVVLNINHNLTFVPSSYSTLPIPPSVFQVPSYCQNKCPHPFPG